MRRPVLFLLVALLGVSTCGAAAAGPGWKALRSVRGGLSLSVPRSWSTVRPDSSTPGVVLQAFDERKATAAGAALGVQVTIVPGPRRSLAALAALLLQAVRKQPVVGTVAERRVRLPAAPSERIAFRVRTKAVELVIVEYALVVHGESVVVAYFSPFALSAAYRATFVRSANTLRSAS